MTYTDLTPGTAFMFEGNPYVVISSEFHRMQMRKAVMRATIRNLLTGQLLQKTFSASDNFESADVVKIEAQFLYRDNDYCYFMGKDTFEQYHATKEVLGEKVKYLSEEITLSLILYKNNPVQIILPKNVNLKVIESPLGIKGDSVSNTFKTITCENDIKLTCPLFIKEGDMIKVDTETGKYIERIG